MTTTKQYDFLHPVRYTPEGCWGRPPTNRAPLASPGDASPLSHGAIWSGPSASSFNYVYNLANRRIRTTLGDGSSWLYTYDSLGQVHPVRYSPYVLLRLRAPQRSRRSSLRGLHPRPQATSATTPKRGRCVDRKSASAGPRLLGSVPEPSRCHAAGKVPQDRLGQAVPQEPAGQLSHGVNAGRKFFADQTPVPGQQFNYAFDNTCPVREGRRP